MLTASNYVEDASGAPRRRWKLPFVEWTCLLGLLAFNLPGQLPDRGDPGGFQSEAYTGEAGYVFMDSRSSVLKWVEYAQSQPTTMTVGFNRPGDSVYLGGNRYLISGLSVTGGVGIGVLSIVSLDSNPRRQISIESSVTYSQLDPYKLSFNASEARLYAYDVAGRRVLYIPFSLPGTLPVGNPWIEVATTMDVPGLNASNQYMVYLAVPTGTTGVSVVDRGAMVLGESTTAWQVDFTPPSLLVVTPHTDLFGDAWSVYRAYPRAAGPLNVGGFTGEYSLQEKESQAIVLTGSNTTPGFEPLQIPSGSVVPGATYRIKSSDEQAVASSTYFVLYNRWGEPSQTSQATPPVRFNHVLFSHDLFVGSAEHAVTGRMDWVDPLESAHTTFHNCYLWVGVNSGAGSVVEIGPNAFIANPIGMVGPFSVTIEGEIHGSILTPLAVANDPNLEGVEALFQFSADIGSETIVSDVIGAAIGGVPIASAGSASSPRFVKRGKDDAARMRAWLRTVAKTGQPAARRWASILKKYRK